MVRKVIFFERKSNQVVRKVIFSERVTFELSTERQELSTIWSFRREFLVGESIHLIRAVFKLIHCPNVFGLESVKTCFS